MEAGFKGLDKTIDFINVQELARKGPWMKPNGFILTTFNDFDSMDDILKQLEWYVEMKISALGFHTAVQKKIPQKILNFADNHNIPLFSIPANAPYWVLFERINSFLNQQALSLKEQVDSVNESMLQAVIHEKDVHHIVQMIGDYLNSTTFFLDDVLDVAAIWNTSNFRREDVLKVIDRIKEKEGALLDQCRFDHKPRKTKTYMIKSNKLMFNFFPIFTNQDFYGFLFVATPELKFSQYEVIIKHGITALQLDALKRNSTKEFLKNKDVQILEGIFSGRDQTEINENSFHYKILSVQQVLIAQSNNVSNIKEQYLKLNSILHSQKQDYLLWISDNKIIGLLSVFTEGEIGDMIATEINDIRIGLSGRFLNVNASDFRKHYDQAKVALEHAMISNRSVSIWGKLKSYRMLQEMTDSHLLRDFDKEMLEPLMTYDQNHDSELMYTLDIYLQSFCNVKKSADLLFVHYNTVKYRLEKIKEIMPSLNFDDPEDYTTLFMAMKLYHFKKKL